MVLKLSASDKQTIVELYQHPEESTATLASRYGVSSSTISRILKQELSPGEYQDIVQQKKGGGSKPQMITSEVSSEEGESPQLTIEVANKGAVDEGVADESGSKTEPKKVVTKKAADKKVKTKTAVIQKAVVQISETESFPEEPLETPIGNPIPKKTPRTRKWSSSKAAPKIPESATRSGQLDNTQRESESDGIQLSLADTTPAPPILKSKSLETEVIPSDELVDEIQADLLDGESFDLDDDDLSSDSDDELDNGSDLELDDAAEDTESDDFVLPFAGDTLSVLPFTEAKLPTSCYVIVDRSAELITRPLRTFADLGNVPEAEVDEQTLPIFDNHRVAKRFANRRTQRIVKVPDAQVLRKTSPYLMDKGITRLLLDGQVYALMEEEEFDEE